MAWLKDHFLQILLVLTALAVVQTLMDSGMSWRTRMRWVAALFVAAGFNALLFVITF